jgi:hypothetical protein
MKAYLIDPFTQQVTQVEYNGDYHQIYKLIDCDTFDVARINNQGDGIFIDDEGLFKEEQMFFKYSSYPNPLAGKGLILGTDKQGNSIEPRISLQEAIDSVDFVMPVRINGAVAFVSLG